MSKKKIIIFSGQGNVSELDLKRISQQKEVEELLSELIQSDRDAAETINAILFKGSKIDSVYKSILTTFFYNEYYVRKSIAQTTVSYATAHSAGIFNLLLFENYCDMKEVLQLIKQRSKLLTQKEFHIDMYFFMCSDFYTLETMIDKYSEIDACISIITDKTSGVMVGKTEQLEKLKQILAEKNIKLILKKSAISIPYHSNFLRCIEKEYKILIKSFKIDENNRQNKVQFIFEKNNTLEDEIIDQLTSVFNWKIIKQKIRKLDIGEIYDSSPNKFITKQFKRLNMKVKYS